MDDTLIEFKECESDIFRALLFQPHLANGHYKFLHGGLFECKIKRLVVDKFIDCNEQANSSDDAYDLVLRHIANEDLCEVDKCAINSAIQNAAYEADSDSDGYVHIDEAMLQRRFDILLERFNKKSLGDCFTQALGSMNELSTIDIKAIVVSEIDKQEQHNSISYCSTLSDAIETTKTTRNTPGLYSKIGWWDQAMSGSGGQGLGPGTKVAIAALPGVGKTALALQAIIGYLRTNLDLKVVWGLTEMTKKAMVQRAIQCISGLTLPKIRTSPDLLSKDDNESRDYAMQVLLDIGQRLTFVEAPVTSNRIKSTVISTGAKICVIDYLQRMMPDVIEEGSNKTAHMDHCLGGLLQLSQQQDCSVIMISSTPKRIDPKTRIMDCFRDTGGAAFDADIIYFGENNEDSKSAEVAGCKTVTWHCEKHREGITHISANFDGSVMRYVDGITYE